MATATASTIITIRKPNKLVFPASAVNIDMHHVMKLSKKFMAGALASLLAMSMTVSVFAETASPAAAAKEMADGKAVAVDAATSGGASKVDVKKGSATINAVDTAAKELTFGEVKAADGSVATATALAGKALNKSKATSLTVTTEKAFTFNKNAVSGASKLATITVESKKVTLKASSLANAKKLRNVKLSNITKKSQIKLAKNSFKGMKSAKKVKIWVSAKTTKKDLKAIKKYLKDKGFKGTVKKLKK